jgi:hypothetical protein
VSILAILVALALMGATPALAAQPTHAPSEILEPLELPAGTSCDFGVTINTTVLNAKTSIWEEEDGTVRLLDRGYADGYAESEDGSRITHRGGYRIEIVFHPDGSIDFHGSGTLFGWYFDGDPIVGLADPGAYAISGRLSEFYAPDGSLASAHFYGGNVVNLCDALAP